MTKAKDFSQLSALLAEQTSSPAKKATVTKLRVPANDNKPARPLLAWPAFERLAHRGDQKRLYALRHWKNMIFPQQIAVPDDEQPYEPECAIEIRPSEAELLAAIGRRPIGRERWDFTGEMLNYYDDKQEPGTVYRTNRNGVLEAQIGNLTFRKGALVQWGETRKGAALRPVERPRGMKGGNAAIRSESAIRSYLDLKGATSPFTAEPYSRPMSSEPAIGDFYQPLPRQEPSNSDRHGRFGVREARAVLQRFGVDGSIPFDMLPFPATRCPTAIVAGDQFVGGVKQPKPTASEPAGREPEFVKQVETLSWVEYLRHRLGDHAKVLDLAITDASAKSIGIAMGKGPAYAEKCGPALIDAAIDALIAADETARGEFTPAEEKIAA